MKFQRNAPASHAHFFQYQPEKIETGTRYHYKKTNLDGTNPASVFIYAASKSHIEVLKIEQNSDLVYETVDMNWEVFCPDHMRSWSILADGSIKQQAAASLSLQDHSFRMWAGEEEHCVKGMHYPLYLFTFDLTGLNFAFRHLINPYESFEIGMVEPGWKNIQNPGSDSKEGNPNAVIYRGKAQIDYLGDDLIRDHICHKYRISGEAWGNQTGTIWVSKSEGHFVSFEVPYDDNPAGDSLKIELQSIEHMTAGAWHQFILSGHTYPFFDDLITAEANQQKVEPAQNKSREKAWIEDIEFFATTLEDNHPYLYHDLAPDRFHQAVSELKTNAGKLPDHKILVELGKILASVEDGHTSAHLGHDMLRKTTGFRKVPLVLQYFEDGLFVTAARSEYRHCLGAKVIGIEDHPLDTVEQALIPLVSRSKKNEMKWKQDLPDLMVTAEVLQAVDLCEDMEHISFQLEDDRGEIFSVDLEPLAVEKGPFNGIPIRHGSGEGWITAYQQNNAPAPLYLSNPDNPYWGTHLEKHETFYFQYNQVTSKKGEPLSDFCQNTFAFLDHTRPKKLIVDIRLNPGGDGTLNWNLIREIKKREWLNKEGRLFTIIGRKTFSAAMMAAVALERQTGTIFVGEPTGASPNHFGDSNLFTLPNSGATMMHSSIYWQLSDPDDDRPWIAPDIPVKYFSKDFISGRDPALEAILTY